MLLHFAGQEVPGTLLGTFYMIFSTSVYILGINIFSYWASLSLVILYDYLARCLLFLGMFIYFVMHESNKTFLAWCKQMSLRENTTMPFYLSVFHQPSSYTDSPTLTVGNIALLLLWNWLSRRSNGFAISPKQFLITMFINIIKKIVCGIQTFCSL